MDLWGFNNIYDLFGLPDTASPQQLQARINHWWWARKDYELNG